jgi:hypothetical protein
VPVHDIDVDQIRAAAFGSGDVAPEGREIC